MNTPNRNQNLRERTFQFALRVLRLSQALGRDAASQTVARQVLRSGTSVGANTEEAHGSASRADFARRMNIARAEARETLYWLRPITEGGLLPRQKTSALLKEADEILRIMVATMRTLRNPKGDGK